MKLQSALVTAPHLRLQGYARCTPQACFHALKTGLAQATGNFLGKPCIPYPQAPGSPGLLAPLTQWSWALLCPWCAALRPGTAHHGQPCRHVTIRMIRIIVHRCNMMAMTMAMMVRSCKQKRSHRLGLCERACRLCALGSRQCCQAWVLLGVLQAHQSATHQWTSKHATLTRSSLCCECTGRCSHPLAP